jgi:hypothetical protein
MLKNRKGRPKKNASPSSLILTGAGLILIAVAVLITASRKTSPEGVAVGVSPVPARLTY